jgi:hypothetical protein
LDEGKDDDLSYMFEDESQPPDIPEPHAAYLEMKEFGFTGWWGGGFSSQPYIWLKEIQACKSGVSKFEQFKAANLRLRKEYAKPTG